MQAKGCGPAVAAQVLEVGAVSQDLERVFRHFRTLWLASATASSSPATAGVTRSQYWFINAYCSAGARRRVGEDEAPSVEPNRLSGPRLL